MIQSAGQRVRWIFALLTLTAFLAGGCATAREPTIVLSLDSNSSALAVKGLDATSLDAFDHLERDRQQEVLHTWVANAPTGAPSILGQTRRSGDELVFTPRYPFQPGLKYRAEFDRSILSPNEGHITAVFWISAPPAEPAFEVAEIYPTSDELPENLLKFYIHFSGPMSRGEAYEHIHLLDDRGMPVAKPFLELEEELWNPQMTRFTLFFDPGRIKHGLVSQMQLGPALAAGKSYKLVIDAAWHDSNGRPLKQSITKTFRTIPAERQQPDPVHWHITPPRSGSRDALRVVFDKPLDHAMLLRVISVRDADGRPVSGEIKISEHERQWSYVPELPWHPGHYALSVETILEDTAGNSIGRAFEVDMNQKAAAEEPGVISIPVEIRE